MKRCVRPIICPSCCSNVEVLNSLSSVRKCDTCGQIAKVWKCPTKACQFQHWRCFNCDTELPRIQGRPSSKSQVTSEYDKSRRSHNSRSTRIYFLLGFLGIFFSGVVIGYFLCRRSELMEDVRAQIKNLKKEFPSQTNETWYHFLSVLEKENPSVKSITLLHGEDKRTPDCLTSKLISLYSRNEKIRREEITFSAAGFEAMDYGFALDHYHEVVRTFRVFVTDLTEVPGKIARIFHSLCDDVSSDIKPSLFIFTLKFDKKTEKLKPMERANTILKEAWSDLPENEMFPLLSRVIRNVVDVVPEPAGKTLCKKLETGVN